MLAILLTQVARRAEREARERRKQLENDLFNAKRDYEIHQAEKRKDVYVVLAICLVWCGLVLICTIFL